MVYSFVFSMREINKRSGWQAILYKAIVIESLCGSRRSGSVWAPKTPYDIQPKFGKIIFISPEVPEVESAVAGGDFRILQRDWDIW